MTLVTALSVGSITDTDPGPLPAPGCTTYTRDKPETLATVVVLVAALLPGTSSTLLVVTLAAFDSVPGAVGVTMIVTVALAPLASAPMLQVTVLVPEQVPIEAVADPNV